MRLENAWLLPEIYSSGKYQLVSLLLIKHDYPFVNRFLENQFNPNFDIPSTWALNTEESETALPIQVKGETDDFTSFYLNPSETVLLNTKQQIIGTVFFLIGLLLLLFIFGNLGDRIKEKLGQWAGLVFVLISSFGLKLFLQVTHYPAALYQSELFDPSYYCSSSLLPSLGDFLLSAIIFTKV